MLPTHVLIAINRLSERRTMFVTVFSDKPINLSAVLFPQVWCSHFYWGTIIITFFMRSLDICCCSIFACAVGTTKWTMPINLWGKHTNWSTYPCDIICRTHCEHSSPLQVFNVTGWEGVKYLLQVKLKSSQVSTPCGWLSCWLGPRYDLLCN